MKPNQTQDCHYGYVMTTAFFYKRATNESKGNQVSRPQEEPSFALA
jgi:hypothetical protein